MSKILCKVIIDELTQEIRYKLNSRASIGAFYPYLLISKAPAGTFTFTLLKGEVEIFSKSFTSADIRESVNPHEDNVRVFFPIIPDNPVQLEKGLYTAKISAVDYFVKGREFLAWIQQHEDIQTEIDYIYESQSELPLSMRIKTYKRGIE